jgi:hypothetical protein
MENWLLIQTFYHGLRRRWLPTKVGIKNVFRLAREVEVCINSSR